MSMASTISPSKFEGLSWEAWTNALGRTSPIPDEPPELSPDDLKKGCAAKLPKEDMKTFGQCPEVETFSVVSCDTCGILVKPQALLHHYKTRHNGVSPEYDNQHGLMDSVVAEEVEVETSAETSAEVAQNEDNQERDGGINPTNSLPVFITSNVQIPDSCSLRSSQKVIILTSLRGSPITPTVTPVFAVPTCRPPRRLPPLKDREYDPDKHCGVLTIDDMKPCLRSLTCKFHPVSLRRAVPDRSKPFDQLIIEHKQYKEPIKPENKNILGQILTVAPTAPPTVKSILGKSKIKMRKIRVVVAKIVERLPELDSGETHSISDLPPTLVLNGEDYLTPAPVPVTMTEDNPSGGVAPASTSSTTETASSTSPDLTDDIPYTLSPPQPLAVPSMLTTHKIGGLVYPDRKMQSVRQGLESCLNSLSNGTNTTIQKEQTSSGHRKETSSRHRQESSSQPSSLSNALDHAYSRASLDENTENKPNKINKNLCFPKESILRELITNGESVSFKQTPSIQPRAIPPITNVNQLETETIFKLPTIISKAPKRPADGKDSNVKKIQKKITSFDDLLSFETSQEPVNTKEVINAPVHATDCLWQTPQDPKEPERKPEAELEPKPGRSTDTYHYDEIFSDSDLEEIGQIIERFK